MVCCNGEEAIRALSERRFDLILLDLMMPKRNGLEVIEFLREQRPEQLRVVWCSLPRPTSSRAVSIRVLPP